LITRKGLLSILLAFIFSTAIISVGTALSIPRIDQTNSATTVHLNPPTITGVTVGEEFNVNIMISTDEQVRSWMVGLTFNSTVLNCTGFVEGEFLSNAGPTFWIEGSIDNTLGVITAHGAVFLGEYTATGDGRLAYLTFRVKAPGVSDLHLRDVKVVGYDFDPVPTSIIDVFTVILDTAPHSVVTVSDSTGKEEQYGSGFYDHAFSESAEEISFKVTGPYAGSSKVTIPKALLNASTLDLWRVIIDSTPVSTADRTATENATHTSISFDYIAGIHNIKITTRTLLSSDISISLSSDSVDLESDVIISGDIDPVRDNVTVTILHRSSGVTTWTTLATAKTDSNSHYSYTWTTDKTGTYEVKASWAGDSETDGAESEIETLAVKGAEAGIPLEYIAVAVVAILIIVAVIIYYAKFRKPEEE